MSIIITGGAGFIGSHTAKALDTEGHDVWVYDNLSTGSKERFRNSHVKFVHGDVRDLASLVEIFKGTDVVVHLAALTSVTVSQSQPSLYHDVNVQGTQNVIKAAVKSGVSKILFASSAAVYGNPISIPISEDQPLRPQSVYAKTKVQGEEMLNKCSIDTFALRFFNVYGHGQPLNAYAGVITRFNDALKNDENCTIFGAGTQTRDFVYIDDVVSAIKAALDVGGKHVLNVGTGQPTSINALYETLAKIHGRTSPPVYEKARGGEIEHSVADITRAHAVLRYRPMTSLEEGLRKIARE